jgi:hypothetical protein
VTKLVRNAKGLNTMREFEHLAKSRNAKMCENCRETKASNAFLPSKFMADGLTQKCKICILQAAATDRAHREARFQSTLLAERQLPPLCHTQPKPQPMPKAKPKPVPATKTPSPCDLHEDHPLAWQIKHLQSRQECGNQRRADRTLLCTPLAAISADGEEPAELW